MKAVSKANRKGLEFFRSKNASVEDFEKSGQPSFIILIAYCTTSLSGHKELMRKDLFLVECLYIWNIFDSWKKNSTSLLRS